MKHDKANKGEEFMNIDRLTPIDAELVHDFSKDVMAYFEGSVFLQSLLASRSKFAEMSKREVLRFVKAGNLCNSHRTPEELLAIQSEVFERNAGLNPIAAVLFLKRNNECELFLLNVTNSTHYVSFGDSLTVNVDGSGIKVASNEGHFLFITYCRVLEIVGPTKSIAPHQIISAPIDIQFHSHDDPRSGLTEVVLILTIDGEEYGIQADYIVENK